MPKALLTMLGVGLALAVAACEVDPLPKVTYQRMVHDKQTGEQKERTEWHKVAMFGRLAEISAEYLRKGSQVYIEGRLRTRKWQDKDGNDRWTTEVIADEMQMLGGRGGGGAPARGGDDNNYSQSAPASKAAAEPDEFDDDIPF